MQAVFNQMLGPYSCSLLSCDAGQPDTQHALAFDETQVRASFADRCLGDKQEWNGDATPLTPQAEQALADLKAQSKSL